VWGGLLVCFGCGRIGYEGLRTNTEVDAGASSGGEPTRGERRDGGLLTEPPIDTRADASLPDIAETADSTANAGASATGELLLGDGGQDASESQATTTFLPASTFYDSTGPACTNAILGCGGECAPCPLHLVAPEMLSAPNFAGNDLYSPTPSSDGLTLWFGLMVSGGRASRIRDASHPY
jgi:hypothetical protein